MGRVIGRNREQLYDIEEKTGATLKVSIHDSNSSLFIKGSTESQKKAIRKIKEIVVSFATRKTAGTHANFFPEVFSFLFLNEI